ncbi:transposase [Thioflavicoccus mobilis 8321]|uniref:Transposase n=1 Tax=Thioflavicoccus mobilis 8321 TaxID=765912 RepID=L0GX47_9GAMM|nr:transposase [Thioflavicoccus mobilis]AGA90402.1 transposase [Thioflavicoccus mobilis 8321]
MARLPRFLLSGYPQHIIQRGNARQRILVDEGDYWYLWDRLTVAAAKFECAVHAYALMPDHYHLLLTPSRADGVGSMMQDVGRYYVRYFNRRYERTGTLWEGRYRATLLDPAGYLFACCRYIEDNPVRAGLASDPMAYRWSSHAAKVGGSDDRLVTPHPFYRHLGRSRKGRQAAYAALWREPLAEDLLTRIRNATNKAWVLGEEGFCQAIEDRLNRRAKPLPRGGDRRSVAYRLATGRAV